MDIVEKRDNIVMEWLEEARPWGCNTTLVADVEEFMLNSLKDYTTARDYVSDVRRDFEDWDTDYTPIHYRKINQVWRDNENECEDAFFEAGLTFGDYESVQSIICAAVACYTWQETREVLGLLAADLYILEEELSEFDPED